MMNDVTWTDLDAGLIAAAFHQRYERLAPYFGYKTKEESAVGWGDVPEQNRRLMIAVAKSLLQDGVIRGGKNSGQETI